jgi:ankyrin repeat protein
VDARDSKGETPLRRAANLNREKFVDMLLSHGADPLSQDKRGVTVLASAKHRGIKQSLEEAQKRRKK